MCFGICRIEYEHPRQSFRAVHDRDERSSGKWAASTRGLGYLVDVYSRMGLDGIRIGVCSAWTAAAQFEAS